MRRLLFLALGAVLLAPALNADPRHWGGRCGRSEHGARYFYRGPVLYYDDWCGRCDRAWRGTVLFRWSWYDGRGWSYRGGLPPGLARRHGNLPPGLQKQLWRKGQLPPGLEKRVNRYPWW